MKRIIHFQKISIIGLKLLGGAIGMAVKRLGIADHVVGIGESREDFSQKAKDLGVVDEWTSDLAQGIRDCDFLILNLPKEETMHMLPQIASLVKPGCIVTDTSGIKKNIVDQAVQLFKKDRFFIGSHPMICIEERDTDKVWGIDFRNETAFVTFVSQTDRTALTQVSLFWKTLGMIPFLIDPERHDRYMALVSHLPYMAAGILTRMASDIPEERNFILQLTGKGFRDMTRIAGGDAVIWSDILMENAVHILPQIERMMLELQTFKKMIERKDSQELKDIFTNISDFRNKL